MIVSSSLKRRKTRELEGKGTRRLGLERATIFHHNSFPSKKLGKGKEGESILPCTFAHLLGTVARPKGIFRELGNILLVPERKNSSYLPSTSAIRALGLIFVISLLARWQIFGKHLLILQTQQ